MALSSASQPIADTESSKAALFGPRVDDRRGLGPSIAGWFGLWGGAEPPWLHQQMADPHPPPPTSVAYFTVHHDTANWPEREWDVGKWGNAAKSGWLEQLWKVWAVGQSGKLLMLSVGLEMLHKRTKTVRSPRKRARITTAAIPPTRRPSFTPTPPPSEKKGFSTKRCQLLECNWHTCTWGKK